MNILPFLHYTSFLINLLLAIYIFSKDMRSLVNWSFAAALLCFSVWSFGMIAQHNPATPKHALEIYFTSLTCFGWIPVNSFALVFMLAFTERKQILKSKLVWLVLFGIPAFLIYKRLSGFLIVDHVLADYGWHMVWGKSIWTHLFFAYYAIGMFVLIYLILDFIRKTKKAAKKKQAIIIFFSLIPVIILISITNFIFPKLGIYNIPNVANIFMLIMAGGIVYAMAKHRLMIISPAMAAENIISTIPDCLILLDKNGHIVSANRQTLDLLGYGENEIKDLPISTFFREKDLKNALFDEIVTGENFRARALIFKTKSKGNVSVSFSRSALSDESGDIAGIVCVATDMTEQQKAEKEKKRLETELAHSQKMEAIGTLAGGIAHNFNNVLYPIMGYTEMVMEDAPKDSLARKNLKEVLIAANRAKVMVKQILTFSRQTDEDFSPIDVAPIIDDVVRLMKATLPATIQIKSSISEKRSIVMGDPAQIHQMLINLCTNAYHAMTDSGGELEIVLDTILIKDQDVRLGSALGPGSHIRLSISDTGTGIAPQLLERIFDPYFTTKPVGKGTGMGLSIAHAVIEKHKGEIRVQSRLGKGSVFDVFLPVIDKSPDLARSLDDKPIPGGTERILLVDDEKQILDMTKQILNRLGYHVTDHASSADALNAFSLAPGNFDIMITDMTMPHMTGSQLAKKILDIKPGFPIVLCTGFSEKIAKGAALEADISAYLTKPLNKREIALTIRKVLEKNN